MVSDRSARRPPAPRQENRGASVAGMVESVLGCKWTVRLLGLIAGGCHRPSALLRNCPGLSAKVLNQRLRKLVRFGIITRVVHGATPPVQVEYRLTAFGDCFVPVLDAVRRLQAGLEQGNFSEANGTDEAAPSVTH